MIIIYYHKIKGVWLQVINTLEKACTTIYEDCPGSLRKFFVKLILTGLWSKNFRNKVASILIKLRKKKIIIE